MRETSRVRGVNIGGVVDVEAVAEFAKTLPNVVLTKTSTFTCSEPGQQMIAEDIVNHNLNRIVVGACTPKIHEPTYRALVESAGLSQYYFQMVNLREQVSFVNPNTKEEATEKAKALMAAGVERALILDDVPLKELDVVKEALVVGGGIGGISAALAIANAGYKTYLVESLASIGGKMAQLDRTFPTDDCSI
jgi:heterodisulfide reductase subunit A